ncbi:hypothetical protein Tco_1457103 [Tanacetum coccineum]
MTTMKMTAKDQYWKIPICYDDDEEYTIAITPDLPTKEPEYSLIMGDEHLSTIPEKESDELIKSSVENLVPISSESEVTSDKESECDMPVCDDFTTFSNPLFDSNDDFTSDDDESLSDDEVLMENFKIYSNHLFDDEEIISLKIDPHYFNAESNLIEFLLNHDILIDSSPKFDYLLEEFSGELTHIDPIPPGIEKADFDLEEEIRLVENLLYDNSSPRLSKDLNLEIADTILESLSPSPILVEDSDSHMEEIDLFLATNDSMPPGIKNDDYDSEGDIRFLEELLNNDSLSLPENESSNLDHFNDPSPSRPPPEPPDVEICFDFKPDAGVVTNKVVGDISEHDVLMPNILPTQPTLCPVFNLLLPFSSENEDKVFNPGKRIENGAKTGIYGRDQYPRESSFDLEAYSDSDYAGANLDRKSTTEAEYVAAASCCGQVLWIQNQMLDYGFNFMNTKIHIDNESTICIVKNLVYHSKTKHIEIGHHFIRDSYEKKLIRVEKIHTYFNVTDVLNKAFDGPSKLQLADASGISMLPNTEIFEGMGNMGYPADAEPTPHPKSPSPEPDSEPIEHTFEQPSPEHQPLSPIQETELEDEPKRGLSWTMGKRTCEIGEKRLKEDGRCSQKETCGLPDYEDAGQSQLYKVKRLQEEEKSKGKRHDTDFEILSTGALNDITQHYTEEDWDAIRAKLEANAELTKSVLEKELQEEDFAKKIVELVNQRNEFLLQNKTKLTQEEGTWKLTQLKKLSFEEVKEEFDKLVKQVESFVPINIEATKAQLKRYGEELQTKISKKQRIDDKDVSDTEETSGKVIRQKSQWVIHEVWNKYAEDAFDSVLWSESHGLYYVHLLKEDASSELTTTATNMITDRKYPLSKMFARSDAKMKLLDGKMNDVVI